ncbi:MAG: ATP-dependent zinc protease family protein [Patiriisocius sp.]|uniref:ATP-dependent zinc protease family protein n=1 Tax=Patiriisocius sp. TaxID=2822396 RepID=UPI003EF24CE1
MTEKKEIIKKVIGRVDKADFPSLKLENIDIKIDTGAFTSSIHCRNVKVENNYLKCTFLDEEHPNYHEKEFTFDTYDVRVVRSSNGETQTRYRILTEIILFKKSYPIFLTLSDRGEMKYPVLIGRKFLNKKFMVDINAKNTSYKLKKKEASN